MEQKPSAAFAQKFLAKMGYLDGLHGTRHKGQELAAFWAGVLRLVGTTQPRSGTGGKWVLLR
jgi:hypothetical protein